MVLAVVVSAVVGWWGNAFRIEERRVRIPVATGHLDGVLATPREGDVRGLVVMVHGDGPVDATYDGLYRPWFEAAADAGFATLSWSKPGVGESDGNWLDQSMDDRADEVSAAIDWMIREGGVPITKVVLWGASQGGWVLPKVAAERPDVNAVVAVSPAINWLRQGRFNLLAEMDRDGVDEPERARRIATSDQTRRLLEAGANYSDYRAITDDPDPMNEDRWTFVQRNFTADATDDLYRSATAGTPTLLMLGRHDHNVDVDDTEAGYRAALGGLADVRYYDAAHSMARPEVENSDLRGLLTAVFRPRTLLAPGVLSDYRDYLAAR